MNAIQRIEEIITELEEHNKQFGESVYITERLKRLREATVWNTGLSPSMDDVQIRIETQGYYCEDDGWHNREGDLVTGVVGWREK